MKPVITGGIVAAAIIVAFIAGSMIEIESDGDITLSSANDGPLERAGEKLDEAAQELEG